MASHLLPKKLYTTHFAKAFCVYDQDQEERPTAKHRMKIFEINLATA